MASRSSLKPLFKVGDVVIHRGELREMRGTIIEDRGVIGQSGVRTYRVEVPYDPYNLELKLYREDTLVKAPPAPPPPTPEEVVDYLIHGGLREILHTNLTPGEPAPGVWLKRHSYGIAYSLRGEAGDLGGMGAPFLALSGKKIAADKIADVRAFIMRSFELTPEQADKVIAGVGTAN